MKWKLGFAAVLLLCAVMMTMTASANTQSGTCGDNLTWTLTDDGVLTISGNGPMSNYDWRNESPWGDKPVSVIMADGVTSIGNRAFYFCDSLESVTIPDSVTSIGDSAFFGCGSLKSVTIPESVTGIGEYAFTGCSSLESVTIPEGVTSIGACAFSECSGLTSVIIPKSVLNINANLFPRCDKLTDIRVSEDHPTLAVIDGVLFSKADKRLVCYPRAKTGTYVIPQGTLEIGKYAFNSCSSLTSVTIPESVTSIGYAAFAGSGLTSVTIPESVTSISVGAFSDCGNLTSVTIPESVTSIGDGAFAICLSLSSVTIPESVTSIGDEAFGYCVSLTSVTFQVKDPDAQITFGSDIFTNSSPTVYCYRSTAPDRWCQENGITPVYFDDEPAPVETQSGTCGDNLTWTLTDDGVLTISGTGPMVGYDWMNKSPWGDKPVSVIMADGVTSIGEYAFNGCGSLESVTIPEGVTRIGDDTFTDCSSLTSVTIPEGVTSIGTNAFVRCVSLTSAAIPDSVTNIGECAFYCCSSLASVTIPNSLKSISTYTFASCSSLTSVTFPDSVTSIGEYAFMECSGLNSVTFQVKDPAAEMEIGSGVFSASSPTFYCYRSTAPDRWCQENGITPVYLDDEPVPCQHVPEDVPEVKPTKDQPGRTAGTKCSVCGEILSGCEEIPALGYEPGDLNGNGTIDGRDLLRLARYLAGGNVEINEAAADLNGDGKVDGRDLLRLARYLAGQDVKLGK